MALPLPTNITGFLSLTQYVNVITEGHFGWLMLVLIAIILYILMKGVDDVKTSFIALGFIMLIFTILFYLAELVTIPVLIISIFLCMVGVFVKTAFTDY
jgi:hypothetical protein